MLLIKIKYIEIFMKKTFVTLFSALILCGIPPKSHAQTTTVTTITKTQPQEPMKVVYHLTEGTVQASKAIGNICNHLAANPTAKIVVVAHGSGIDFLLIDAKDANGQGYEGAVSELVAKGVDFRVCNNTLA